MKFTCQNYNSPIPTQGKFENVTVEETEIIHRGKENYLSVKFEMFYFKDNLKVVLATKLMEFIGTEADIYDPSKTTTNLSTLVKIANPDFDPLANYLIEQPNPEWTEGSELPETITVDTTPPTHVIVQLFSQGGLNITTNDFEIVEFGYPTYEKAVAMLHGGSFEQPKITITDALAVGFILKKLIINGEPVGNQFQLM